MDGHRDAVHAPPGPRQGCIVQRRAPLAVRHLEAVLGQGHHLARERAIERADGNGRRCAALSGWRRPWMSRSGRPQYGASAPLWRHNAARGRGWPWPRGVLTMVRTAELAFHRSSAFFRLGYRGRRPEAGHESRPTSCTFWPIHTSRPSLAGHELVVAGGLPLPDCCSPAASSTAGGGRADEVGEAPSDDLVLTVADDALRHLLTKVKSRSRPAVDDLARPSTSACRRASERRSSSSARLRLGRPARFPPPGWGPAPSCATAPFTCTQRTSPSAVTTRWRGRRR